MLLPHKQIQTRLMDKMKVLRQPLVMFWKYNTRL